jgi:hypothetical protein
MKRWRRWLHECPFWNPPPEYGGLVLKVTPTKFQMNLKNSFPQVVPLDQVELYNTLAGSLSADWDSYDPEVEKTSKMRIVILLPNDVGKV